MFKISIQPEEIDKMPLGTFHGKVTVIERPGLEYAKAIAYLMTQKVIGFDTETRPVFTPGPHHNQVALLQLSGAEKAYLFRVNKLGMRRLLCAVLSNPKIIKVGAAVHDDIRGLQHYNHFEDKGFVDLQKIVYEWGIRDKSVKKMAAIILGCRISKSQQLSNWEAEQLTDAQVLYAATDAWVCREMYLKLQQSEKHPLTPEEMMSPKQLEHMRQMELEKQEREKRAAEEKAAAEAAPAAKKKAPAKKTAAKKNEAKKGEPKNAEPKKTVAKKTAPKKSAAKNVEPDNQSAEPKKKRTRKHKHHDKTDTEKEA